MFLLLHSKNMVTLKILFSGFVLRFDRKINYNIPNELLLTEKYFT